MNDDIKLPEPAAVSSKCSNAFWVKWQPCADSLRGHGIKLFTEEQVRAAVLADREQRVVSAEPVAAPVEMGQVQDDAALLKDKARLDSGSILIRVSNGDGGVNERHYRGMDLREAIDAARAAGGEA